MMMAMKLPLLIVLNVDLEIISFMKRKELQILKSNMKQAKMHDNNVLKW